MVNLLKTSAFGASVLLLAGTLMAAPPDSYGVPPAVNTQRTQVAQPGAINYVEGQVSLDGQAITQAAVGSAVLGAGHTLQTTSGKVEVLLTPGVFLRLGPNSAVQMISPSLSDTRVQLVRGQAMMEVADFQKENRIQVTMPGSEASVMRRGIYEFIANPAMARVYDGKLDVTMSDRTRSLGKGDQVALVPANLKLRTESFDLSKTEASNDLYNWSKLRADYTAQANMSAAETYYGGGPGYYAPGAGWYWDPYFNQYAFLLADGFMWDPFGFGFFSPGYWGMYAPYFGYGFYGHGYGYGHGFRAGGAIVRGSAAGAAIGHSGFAGGGYRGGFAGRGAGGFHGGFGGFGGFHGGGGGRR